MLPDTRVFLDPSRSVGSSKALLAEGERVELNRLDGSDAPLAQTERLVREVWLLDHEAPIVACCKSRAHCRTIAQYVGTLSSSPPVEQMRHFDRHEKRKGTGLRWACGFATLLAFCGLALFLPLAYPLKFRTGPIQTTISADFHVVDGAPYWKFFKPGLQFHEGGWYFDPHHAGTETYLRAFHVRVGDFIYEWGESRRRPAASVTEAR